MSLKPLDDRVEAGTNSRECDPRLVTRTFGADSAFNAKLHADGETLLRVSRELREWLANAPADDSDAKAVFRDCDTLERIGKWLAAANAVTFSDGISTR